MRLAPKLLIGAAIAGVLVLVVGFNLGVFSTPKNSVREAAPEAAKGAGFGALKKGDAVPTQGGTTAGASPLPTAPPTPRPTGPGEYACDPYGVCNKYSEEARRQYCRVTYADSRCLDQCGDKEKQCEK